MNPISHIELNAHFKDLERQVATARRAQGPAFGWLRMLWRDLRAEGQKNAKASAPSQPAQAR